MGCQNWANDRESGKAIERELAVQGLNGKMIATAIGLIGGMVALLMLNDFKEQAAGSCPGKDYTYLKYMGQGVVLITLGVTAYILYTSYLRYQKDVTIYKSKAQLFIDFAAFSVVIMQMYMVFVVSSKEDTAVAQAVVDEDIDTELVV